MLGLSTVGQFSRPQLNPTGFVRRLSPDLAIVVAVRRVRRECRVVGADLGGRRNLAVRRGADRACGALGLFAGVGRAVPHRLRHPVKVAAVDEDTCASTSVEADRLALVVELERHERQANRRLGVEEVPHLGGLVRSLVDVARVDEPVVDPLDREFIEAHADGRFEVLEGTRLAEVRRSDLVSHLPFREVGSAENLNGERVLAGLVHLAVFHAIDGGELQDIVPREARLGSPCVDAVFVPLLVSHALHQAFPGEGLRGEGERSIQQWRSGRLCGGVDHERGIASGDERQVELPPVVVFDADAPIFRRGLLVLAVLDGCANLERTDDLRQGGVVVGRLGSQTQFGQRIALAGVLLRVGGGTDGVKHLLGVSPAEGLDRCGVAQVDVREVGRAASLNGDARTSCEQEGGHHGDSRSCQDVEALHEQLLSVVGPLPAEGDCEQCDEDAGFDARPDHEDQEGHEAERDCAEVDPPQRRRDDSEEQRDEDEGAGKLVVVGLGELVRPPPDEAHEGERADDGQEVAEATEHACDDSDESIPAEAGLATVAFGPPVGECADDQHEVEHDQSTEQRPEDAPMSEDERHLGKLGGGRSRGGRS